MSAYKILMQFKSSVLSEEQLPEAIVKARDDLRECFKRELDADKAPVGECNYCDQLRASWKTFHPGHYASSRCESGGRIHCGCDVCF